MNSLSLFAVKVHHVGQFVVGVLANTREEAAKGAEKVVIEYESLTPILTIEVI